MPAPTDEEFHVSAMVDAVRDMQRKLEAFERHGDEERTKLRAGIDATVAAMRKDVWDTLVDLQLDASQHRDEHITERKERAADSIVRANRQTTVDMWMGGLTVLGLINLVLALYLAFHGAR